MLEVIMNKNDTKTKMPLKKTAPRKTTEMPEDFFTPEGIFMTSACCHEKQARESKKREKNKKG
jgi:hypothetical protein